MRRPNVHLRTRVAAVAAGLLLLAIAAPGQALAHAAFVSADPAPGARLSTAPGVVGMHFSEPINRQLSRATLTAPDGRTYDGAVVQGDLQIQLTTDTAGIYEVDWTTVSQIDGHTLRGTYQFGVRATPNSASAQGVTELAPQPADLAVAVARTLEDAALLAAIGGILLGYLASRKPPLAWARIPLRAMLAVALAAIVFPMIKRDAYEGSPAVMTILGLPLITVAAVVASVTLLWVIFRAVVDSAFGANTPFSLWLNAGVVVAAIVWYFVARWYRLRQGVDVADRYKEIPVE